MNVHSFFESLLSVTYINSVTHGAFYFVDYTLRSEFTFVDTFYVNFRWRRTLNLLSIKSLEKILCPIFAARSPLNSPAKLLNLW